MEDTNTISRAREFAIKAHGDQKYEDSPYIVHLDHVDSVLNEFGFGNNPTLRQKPEGKKRSDVPKIKMFMGSLIVKLADRIANVRHSIATGSDLFKMYKKEYPEFRAQLYDCHPIAMWEALDDLMGWEKS